MEKGFQFALFILSLKIYVSGENESVLNESKKDAMSCVQNFVTIFSWVGAAGLFVGFLLFPSHIEGRIHLLLASLMVLLSFVILKLILHTVDKCRADKEPNLLLTVLT